LPYRFNLRVASERHCDRMLRSESMQCRRIRGLAAFAQCFPDGALRAPGICPYSPERSEADLSRS